MKNKRSNNSLNTFLEYPKTDGSKQHLSALQKIAEIGNKVWIQLPNNLIRTRYYLNVIEFNFNEFDTAEIIRRELLNVPTGSNRETNEQSISGFFLVGNSPNRGLFYCITEYLQDCINTDTHVFDRLRGRTVLYIYITDEGNKDLLSDSGVSEFIDEILNNYVESYGTDLILGFSVELPEFLSILAHNGLTLPWTQSFYDDIQNNIHLDETDLSSEYSLSLLPSLFYETHNSPIIRGIFWQNLTSQFTNCFLSSVKSYCIEKNIHFAVTLPESARWLQYDLGTLLCSIDYPILIPDESDTTRRFVVAKSICSNSKRACVVRKEEQTLHLSLNDASKGFNEWLSPDYHSSQTKGSKNRYIHENLIDGYPIRPIVILTPIQSLWMEPDQKKWNNITKAFAWLCDIVWKLGYDFDIVSEKQLSTAVFNSSNGTITINGYIYQLVLLPSCISLHENSVRRLTEYTKYKGRIIADSPTPYLLNGKIGLAPYQLERLIYGRSTYLLDGTQSEREETLGRYLKKWIKLGIRVYYSNEENTADEIKVHQRKIENGDIFYLFNSGSKNLHTLVEILGEDKDIIEIDLSSGEVIRPEFWKANKNIYHDCKFSPKQARLFIVKNFDI
ncbi:hypothetical protein C6497_02190 [Candidatus Poribacteria bacterium]|nr:MAG: hypothetical protein C6497_02190 [Candidatus Poribacteria bacterium]